jgi:putative SOS response-associated peptidase YedK
MLPALDRHRLGAKHHVAENVGLRRFHAVARGKIGIPPIASEGVVLGGDLPGLVLGRQQLPDFATIHAPAETVAENDWFRDAYRKRRCVVPINSFFQKNSSGRRYAISRRDGGPFGVAGIWENWHNPPTEIRERTFAVLIVPANELVALIHDRMLAIVPHEQFRRWLSDEADPRDLLVPFPADLLSVSPQSTRR